MQQRREHVVELAARVVVVPHARLEVLVEASLLERVDQQQLGRRAPAPLVGVRVRARVTVRVRL